MLSRLIREYYSCVDRNEIDRVVSLFADDAVYQRADSRYEGKDSIAHFFRQVRAIRGRHVLDGLWTLDDMVVCTGEFNGHGVGGDKRYVKFADFWLFNDARLVVRRSTYLALGQEHIKA